MILKNKGGSKMLNTPNMSVPEKYAKHLAEIDKDEEGYWAYTKKGFYFEAMGHGCHTAHEDTKKALMDKIKTIEKCDCRDCVSA